MNTDKIQILAELIEFIDNIIDFHYKDDIKLQKKAAELKEEIEKKLRAEIK